MTVHIPGQQSVSANLTDAVSNWKAGKGAVLFVEGETGSGKSFVLDTLESTLGAAAIRVDCRPPIGTFNVAGIQPLQPFGLAIERLYQNGEAAAKKRLAMNIGMSLLASLPIAGDIFYAIKSVRQDVSEFKRETAALAQKKRAAVEECLITLATIGSQTPFVLLVDDGQWSDPQSIEVLRSMMSDPDNKILVVWAYNAHAAREHNMNLLSLVNDTKIPGARLRINNVSEQAITELVHHMAPTLRLTQKQLQILHERSAGLPAIVHEYIRYWQQNNHILPDGSLSEDAITDVATHLGDHPATNNVLHEVPEENAAYLALCAAEGREFTAYLVASLTNTDVISTIRKLRSLERSTGLIKNIGVRTRYGVKSTTFRFTADLPYSFFLHYLSYEERRMIHQRIVEILSAERNNSDVQAIRDQLAILIAAYGMQTDNEAVVNEMLIESHRATMETGSIQSAALILSEIEKRTGNTVGETEDGQLLHHDSSVSTLTAEPSFQSIIRTASDALIEGTPNLALEMVDRYIQNFDNPSEYIMLQCLRSQALIQLHQFDEANRTITLLLQDTNGDARLRAFVLNMHANLALAQNNTDLALTYIQDAAKASNDAHPAAQVLTLCNAVVVNKSPLPSSFISGLRKKLVQSSWKSLAADIGLTLALLLFVGAESLTGQTTTNPIHAGNVERAHPTPDIQKLAKYRTLKIPFIQATETYLSQFGNVSMIADEADPSPMQNESSIAVNPTNPRNLIGSAVDYRLGSQTWAYYSTDAGLTWKNVSLGVPHPGWRSTNDPSVCFDHQGRGYLCYGGFNVTNTPQFGENGVYVSITDDGGLTWSKTHIAVIEHRGTQTADSAFEDKYYIHADTSATSAYRGSLYIPWKRVINADSSTQIVLSKSTDRGLTWSAPVPVGNRFPSTSEHPTFGQSFPLARTSPDGTVHVVWNSGTENAVRYAQSTDGGSTFSEPRIVHTYKPFGEKLEVAGTTNSRVKKVVRAEAYPTLTIDNTNGPRRGWLYLAWAADNYPNVYFSRSTDNGNTWSAAKLVHSDTTNDQFWPWIALDPTNGDLAIMYFDSRDDRENLTVTCYVSYSNDGGTTFIDRRAGDVDHDLRNNPFQGRTFAGDYSGCDFYNGIIYPSWVDMRKATPQNSVNSDVYTAIVKANSPEAPRTFSADIVAGNPNALMLRWSEVSQRVFGQPLPPSATIHLSRDGTPITTLPYTTLEYLDTGLEAYREYHYSLYVVANSDSSVERRTAGFAGGAKQPNRPLLHAIRGLDSLNMPYIALTATLPTTRLDGTTPLSNLAALAVSLNATLTEVPLNSADTGTTRLFVVPTKADGWYRVSLACVDTDGNQSPWTDTLIAFAGNMLWHSERFDTMPNLLVLGGSWGIDTTFSFSSPASFTETPYGDYNRSHRDTVVLYPRIFREWIPEHNAIVLSYAVAAFIDPSDTMFMDLLRQGTDQPHDWKQIAWWNSSLDARWESAEKLPSAWRNETYIIPSTTDTLTVRLRFRSNLTRHADGFYIDDILWSTTTAVLETSTIPPATYPSPASEFVQFPFESASENISISIVSADGSQWPAAYEHVGNRIRLDVRSLAAGMYAAAVFNGLHTTYVPFIVAR